jgi:dipeptidyl-peptidase-4
MRFASLCILVSSVVAAFGPAALHAQTKPLTVSAIFNDPGFTADAPQGMAWSPDGTRLTYLNANGDLIAAWGGSGETTVLVPKAKIGSMHSNAASEKDKDHRSRYGEASYIWAPDAKHVLFDSNGALLLYSLKNGLAISVAEKGTASGDDPKFAPDGSAVTYVRDHNLYLRHLPYTQQAMQLTTSREPSLLNGEVDWLYLEELDVRSNYFWSPDSKNIGAAVPAYGLDSDPCLGGYAALSAAGRSQPGGAGGGGQRNYRPQRVDEASAGRGRGLHSALRLAECAHAVD